MPVSSFLSVFACYLLQRLFKLKPSPAYTHSRALHFHGAQEKRCFRIRRYIAILRISPEIPGPCIASQVKLFPDMFWETWKNSSLVGTKGTKCRVLRSFGASITVSDNCPDLSSFPRLGDPCSLLLCLNSPFHKVLCVQWESYRAWEPPESHPTNNEMNSQEKWLL